MRLYSALWLALLACKVAAFNVAHKMHTLHAIDARRTLLLARRTSEGTAQQQQLKTVLPKASGGLFARTNAAVSAAASAPLTDTVAKKSLLGRTLSALKRPVVALAVGAGVSLAAVSYFYHRWQPPIELEGMVEAMALDLLTAMGLGLDVVEKVVQLYQESFPDNNLLKFTTFLREWAATTDDPNVYDVAVVHHVLNNLLQFDDGERDDVVKAIRNELPPEHQMRALWVVSKTWQENERPPTLKEQLTDPGIAQQFEELDKVAYKHCVRAWCVDILSSRSPTDLVDAMKPPAGYEELGIDVKHAVIYFGEYLQQIVERRPKQNESGRKKIDAVWARYDETKRSPTRTLNARSAEEYEADFAKILEVLQRATGTRDIRPLPKQTAWRLARVRFPIMNDLRKAKVMPANPASTCRDCGLVMFVAKGREFKFVGKENLCPRCGASASFELRDVAEL